MWWYRMKKKICFVASSGGPWEEMMRLKEIANENIAFYVTEKSGQITEAAIPDTYTLPQINRHEKGFFLHKKDIRTWINKEGKLFR